MDLGGKGGGDDGSGEAGAPIAGLDVDELTDALTDELGVPVTNVVIDPDDGTVTFTVDEGLAGDDGLNAQDFRQQLEDNKILGYDVIAIAARHPPSPPPPSPPPPSPLPPLSPSPLPAGWLSASNQAAECLQTTNQLIGCKQRISWWVVCKQPTC